MPQPTIAEIHDQMSDILSSGCGSEMMDYHTEELTKLLDPLPTKLARRAVAEFYECEEPENLREGELGAVAMIIGANDVDVKIVFSYGD